MKFSGYQRDDGSVGARDYVAVIPTVGCVNEVALRIANDVEGAIPILHHQGCCQLSPDLDIFERVITGFGRNPNVRSVLLVSLGCESAEAEGIEEAISSGKTVKMVKLQELGGITETTSRGVKMTRELAMEGDGKERTSEDLSKLVVGVKCGASDTTSGIASNPATGAAVDMLIESGATVIFGETTEVLGAEHVLAKRAKSEEVADEIYRKVNEMEERVKAFGVDMRGSQPTSGNIRGGLTTIEEKSLGAIVKSGTKPIKGVLKYGEQPGEPGLYFMDSPGREMEFLTGLGSAGCQVIMFSTGLGAPQGFPISPVMKISGNQSACEHLEEHIDLDVSTIITDEEKIEKDGERIFGEIIKIASGKKTKAELLEYDKNGINSNIYGKGPII